MPASAYEKRALFAHEHDGAVGSCWNISPDCRDLIGELCLLDHKFLESSFEDVFLERAEPIDEQDSV